MTVKKISATTMPKKTIGFARRTIFAGEPIRRQRDHPGVAAAGHELYQHSSTIILTRSHSPTAQTQSYNTTVTPSHLPH